MNVGLPGTGLGGLFYLATALLMPVWELIATLRGRSNWGRWKQVGLQAGLALGILGGLWLTAWLLRHVAPAAAETTLRAGLQRASRHLGLTPTWLTVMALGSVLLSVEALHVAGWLYRCCRRLRPPQ